MEVWQHMELSVTNRTRAFPIFQIGAHIGLDNSKTIGHLKDKLILIHIAFARPDLCSLQGILNVSNNARTLISSLVVWCQDNTRSHSEHGRKD